MLIGDMIIEFASTGTCQLRVAKQGNNVYRSVRQSIIMVPCRD